MACTYSYKCTSCEKISEHELPITADQKNLHPPCLHCGEPCDYTWVPSVPQIVFKDGPTGSYPSKGNRFKAYRNKQSEIMAKRQLDRYGPPKQAIPNYKGNEVESWREAKSEAIKDKGLEADIPAYDAKIAETSKNKIVV
jgi:DNA-directed RNA polymerase subunit RPC12/RpoP